MTKWAWMHLGIWKPLSSLEQVQPEIHSCTPSGSDLLFSSQASWPLYLLLLPCPAESAALHLLPAHLSTCIPVKCWLILWRVRPPRSFWWLGSFICWGSTHQGAFGERLRKWPLNWCPMSFLHIYCSSFMQLSNDLYRTEIGSCICHK